MMSEHKNTVEALPKSTIFYIIRHGRTVYNDLDLTQGWCDSPLTQEGKLQAEALGVCLRDTPFQLAFASDLGRQKETARRILAHNRCAFVPDLTEENGLREINFGSFEEKPNHIMMEPIFQRYGLSYGEFDRLIHRVDGMNFSDLIAEYDETHCAETTQQVKLRASDAMERIVRQVNERGGGNVLVITSGGLIRILIPLLLHTPKLGVVVENASVSILEYRKTGFFARDINSLAYLAEGREILSSENQIIET